MWATVTKNFPLGINKVLLTYTYQSSLYVLVSWHLKWSKF